MKRMTIACALAFSTSLFAQTPKADAKLTAKPKTEMTKDAKSGWEAPFSIELGGRILSEKNVLSKKDGVTAAYSLMLDANANHFKGNGEWRNNLNIKEEITKEPKYDAQDNTVDDLKFSSMYLHMIESVSWLGFYANLNYETNMFTDYQLSEGDAAYSVNGEAVTTSKLELSKGFTPSTMTESLGLFARPKTSKAMTIESRLGYGARQSKIADTSIIKDNEDTENVIEVVTFSEDTAQSGLEFTVDVFGKVMEDKVSYKAYVKVFGTLDYTHKADDEEDKAFSETMISEEGLNIDYSLNNWTKFAYEFKNKKDPFSGQEEAQTTHTMLVKVAYSGDLLNK